MVCSHCGSEDIKKNGHTHYGKQNYFCHSCKRQFVSGGQDWFVSDSEKVLIDKLLLERIPLSGICRVIGISEAWLLKYIKRLFEELPDNLNADLSIPDLEIYLGDRFDEEIGRIEALKKKSISLEAYVQVSDNEELDADLSDFKEDCLNEDMLFDMENNDLLINELYSKERGARVEFFGIQLDEMWSFVGNKANKQWIWLALNPYNRQIVAFHVGGRSGKDAEFFYEKIPRAFKGATAFFSDYWRAYVKTFEQEQHFAVGKDSGLTAYIERFNCTLRQRSSRLVRKTLSFSKSIDNHIGAIKYFICNYNIQRKALPL